MPVEIAHALVPKVAAQLGVGPLTRRRAPAAGRGDLRLVELELGISSDGLGHQRIERDRLGRGQWPAQREQQPRGESGCAREDTRSQAGGAAGRDAV